uniref:Tick transposon n=1 Tax=Rhipicephalus appendiculatus TaxID=34631 RepID=A0A131YN62_RHIAP
MSPTTLILCGAIISGWLRQHWFCNGLTGPSLDHRLPAYKQYWANVLCCLGPLRKLGLGASEPVILFFGATALGYSHRDVFFTIEEFISETKRHAAEYALNQAV